MARPRSDYLVSPKPETARTLRLAQMARQIHHPQQLCIRSTSRYRLIGTPRDLIVLVSELSNPSIHHGRIQNGRSLRRAHRVLDYEPRFPLATAELEE